MEIAREAAPEIDRLVLAVNALAATRDEELIPLAREAGLDSLEGVMHFADFVLAGVLTPRLAELRLRYRAPELVQANLRNWLDRGLVEHRGDQLVATGRMRGLLEEALAVRARAAAELWHDHPSEVATATGIARVVSQAASPEHEVAVAHREVPVPDDEYLALHTLLTNLRYIRQHDHAEAWSSRGLSAPAMVVMTALWHGSPVEPGAVGLDELVAAGYATADPVALTHVGVDIRDAIEEETDQRAQASFSVLGEEDATAFLAALRILPGTMP